MPVKQKEFFVTRYETKHNKIVRLRLNTRLSLLFWAYGRFLHFFTHLVYEVKVIKFVHFCLIQW